MMCRLSRSLRLGRRTTQRGLATTIDPFVSAWSGSELSKQGHALKALVIRLLMPTLFQTHPPEYFAFC